MTLDEWLDHLRSGRHPRGYIDFQFISGQHSDEFLASISEYSDFDIILVLNHFLMRSVSLGQDEFSLSGLYFFRENEPDQFSARMKHTFYQRLMRYSSDRSKEPPWQGITWVTDLLPWRPREAIAVLDAYLLAHGLLLPDGRINGLIDALAIIRARYIGVPGSRKEYEEFLINIEPREFEHLIDELYSNLGYSCELTPRTSDGGRDILAKREEPGRREQLLIECKRYTSPVGVAIVRNLLGVVSHERSNKGVLVTSSRFTRGAIDLAGKDPRIELISGEDLIPLLNENLGSDWPLRVDGHLLRSKKRNEGA